VGSGALTIVDPSELEFSSMAKVRKNDPVCLIGLRLHILNDGSTFHLHTRVATAPPGIAKRA
jgi:cyanophycinase